MQAKQPRKQLVYQMLRIAQVRLIQTMVHILKELEERLVKRKAEKKETEERLEKQRAEKQEQEERQYNLKIDGKDVDDLTGKMVELLGTSTSMGVMENGVSTFDVLA